MTPPELRRRSLGTLGVDAICRPSSRAASAGLRAVSSAAAAARAATG